MPDKHELTEREKRLAGEPFDVAKLHQEMDDDFLDKIAEGIEEGGRLRRAAQAQPPPQGPPA